jgi:glycosyltransferase involved in cell wall biosynthesis
MKPASLHIFPSRSWGGAEIYTVDLVSWLRDAGENAMLWCPEGSPMHRRALELKIPTITTPISQRSVWKDLRLVAEHVRIYNADILHLHWSGGVWTTWGLRLFTKVKKIYHTHMWMDYPKRDPMHWLAYRELDRLIAAGPRAVDLFSRMTPVSKAKMRISPYGVDFRRITTLIPKTLADRVNIRQRVREKLEWKPTALTVGFFGRLDQQKGTLEFCQALPEFLRRNPNAQVVLVGSPTLNEDAARLYSEKVEAELKANPYRDRILRLPHQTEWEQYLSAVDVLVMPSYRESYSILIATALAMGVPVVGTNEGGTPDLIGAEEERGWLIGARSSGEVERALIEIGHDPSALDKKTEAALQYAFAHHNKEAIASGLCEIYAELRQA